MFTIKENISEFHKKNEEKKFILIEKGNQIHTKFEENFKNIFEMRILKEQINILKSIPKKYGIILSKNIPKGKAFDYDTYFEISKNKFLNLFPAEKITK